MPLISLAMRHYVEHPPTGLDGVPGLAADVVRLVNLVAEAYMLASELLADLLNRFMYDSDRDSQPARNLEHIPA